MGEAKHAAIVRKAPLPLANLWHFPSAGELQSNDIWGGALQRGLASHFACEVKVPEPPDLAKKYSVYVMKDGKRKLISFGDKRYPQFKDKGPGVYSHLDHNDPEKRGFIMRGTVERKIALQQNIGRIGLCGDYSTSSSR